MGQIDKTCGYCQAAPEEPCRTSTGDVYKTVYGDPRYHAARKKA